MPLLTWLTASAFSVLVAVGSTSGTARYAVRQQTYRATTNLVRLDVMASVNGRALTSLTADDFEVLDNGVPQHVQMITTAGNVRVLLLLDVSGSIAWGAKMQTLVRASQALWENLGRDDEASLLTFADRFSLEATAVRDREAFEKKLLMASGHPAGQTALWDALFVGLSLLAGDVDRSLVLVFSDGIDTASWCDSQKVKEIVRYAEAVIYAVTVPPVPALSAEEAGARTEDERFRVQAVNHARESYLAKDLKEVAEQSGGELLLGGQGQALTNTFVSVLEQFRARYLLAYEPAGVRRDDGWHELRVKLKGRAGTIRARSGYYARTRRAGR
jgi:VWFA-related protein